VRASAPFVAEALAGASLRALDAIVDCALSRQVAFVLFAGDIYDGPERGLRAQLRFRRALEQLSECGIASFVVHGNHDPVETGWSAIRSWPPLTTVFGAGEVQVSAAKVNGDLVATVQGVSYGRRDERENLALRFARPRGGGLAIGMLHCNVGGIPGHDDYSPCSLADLRAGGLDYWALGHIHMRSVLTGSPGAPWAVYPGNTQGRSIREGERSAKGVVLVTASPGDAAVSGVEFVPCDSVRFFEVPVDVTGSADLAQVCAVLASAAAQLLRESDGRSLVLRARLSGRGPVHRDLAREGAPAALLRELREDAGEGHPFIWWDSLIDGTRPALTRADIERRNDFLSDLLAVADSATVDRDGTRMLSSRAGAESMPAGLRALAAQLVEDDEDLLALVGRAADLALDLVAEG
jgi:DNA repair exonuclease SbcCD nuclease subunit